MIFKMMYYNCCLQYAIFCLWVFKHKTFNKQMTKKVVYFNLSLWDMLDTTPKTKKKKKQ